MIRMGSLRTRYVTIDNFMSWWWSWWLLLVVIAFSSFFPPLDPNSTSRYVVATGRVVTYYELICS